MEKTKPPLAVMDGAALISALRRIGPHVKVIAASGLKDNNNVARSTGAEVRHFLAKPYSADALLTMARIREEASAWLG